MQSIYILHYRKNNDRKNYLDRTFSRSWFAPQFIVEFDQEEIDLNDVYRFDRAAYDLMVDPIKDLLISNSLCLTRYPAAPWAECYQAVKRLGLTRDDAYARCPWLQPRPLRPAAVSIFLKHCAAWEKIARGEVEWGIVAEDDIVFRPHSEVYLRELLANLPSNFDYIDIAGGSGMAPRGNIAPVNGSFYRIDPPSTRTACCAIIARKFAARLVTPTPPNCVLPVDWSLNAFFLRCAAEIYWVEPTVFEHGSEINAYRSWTKE